tara:strand:+ start:1013 stop:1192 length:180 start_codon:yes stop_codon:yes gene_type:complete
MLLGGADWCIISPVPFNMCLWATNLLFEQQLGNKYTQIRAIGQQIREESEPINLTIVGS